MHFKFKSHFVSRCWLLLQQVICFMYSSVPLFLHFCVLLDVKIALCTTLKTGSASDSCICFFFTPVCSMLVYSTSSGIGILAGMSLEFQFLFSLLLFTLGIDTEFASQEIVGYFLISFTEHLFPRAYLCYYGAMYAM